MELGAVALVLVETIFGKLRAKVTHDPIARHFRDDTGGRDRQTVAITVDDRSLWKRERKHRQSIDQNMLWRKGERGERNPHRFMRGAQNIDPIDLEMIDNPNAPRDVAV